MNTRPLPEATSRQSPSTEAERLETPLRADAGRVVYTISPQETDPRINQELKDHYVMFHSTAKSNGKLLVFFPATTPRHYQLIMDVGARLGYRVIGLEYPNINNPLELCKESDDLECNEKVWLARLSGQPGISPLVNMSPGNGVLERLAALLRFLDENHPDEGWSRFYSAHDINWNLVCLAGHSQGAGMAAFIAKRRRVDRVALFSGPRDFHARSNQLAGWMSKPASTSPASMFVLWHAGDVRRGGREAQVQASTALGLAPFGEPVAADEMQPPYKHSHILFVALPPNIPDTVDGYASHSSTARDQSTPLAADGSPAYAPIWRYMLGDPS